MEDQYIKINKDGQIDAQLKVICLQDGEYVVAYSPALNLAASGETEKKALDSFRITLKIFIDDLHAKQKLSEELQSLGWSVTDHNYHRKMSADDIIRSIPNFIGEQDMQYA